MSKLQSVSNSGHWLVIGAALLWGTTGTAQAFAPAGFDSTVIGALRLSIGGSALLMLAIRRHELGCLKDWKPIPVLLTAVFTAAYQLCFFSAVARTGVAIGTIVGIGSAPVAGGLLGWLFRNERPGGRWFAATFLAICGCALLSLGGNNISVDLIGILLAFGAGASYAAYTLLIKGLLDRLNPTAIMAAATCIGALLLSPALTGIDMNWLLKPRSIAVILHLGLASMALAYWLFARGLQSVPVSTTMTLTLAEPMTAAVLGTLVLREQLSIQAFCGILVIFSGLLVLMTGGRRR